MSEIIDLGQGRVARQKTQQRLGPLADKSIELRHLSDEVLAGVGGNPGTSQVISEAELIAALADSAVGTVLCTESFSISSEITMPSNKRIQVVKGVILTASGTFANSAVFRFAAGITRSLLLRLHLVVSDDDVDGVLIEDTATINRVDSCEIRLPATTTKSAVHIDGQENLILGNRVDCQGSVTSPGCIFLDVNSSDNLVANNIIS